VAVLARREEVGMLRALGVTRRQVLWLFLGEAALMGTVGTLLGLGLGRVLANLAVGVTGATVSTIYIATAAAPPALTLAHVVLAFGLGLPLSLLAALVPALEASRVPPTAAMRGSDRLASRVRLRLSTFLVPVIVLAAAVLLAQLGPVDGRPLFAYGSAFATIIGASLLVPAIIFGTAKVLARPGGDNVGCGDAFIAILVHGMTLGWDLATSGAAASRWAAAVAGERGATPLFSDDVIDALLLGAHP